MTTIQMVKSDAGEVMHLFEVMVRHGVTCGLEMKMDGSADPILGMPTVAKLGVEYIEKADGDSVVVQLDDAEFAFELGKHTFYKHISDCQIDISIDGANYSAWFNSDVMNTEAIEEAKSYDPTGGEFEDKEVILNHSDDMVSFREEMEYLNHLLDGARVITKVEVDPKKATQKITLSYEDNAAAYTLTKLDNYEIALLATVRNLEFNDLLDASNGLEHEADQSLIAARKSENSNPNASKGFEKRSENLRALAEVLAAANADYRKHCEIE